MSNIYYPNDLGCGPTGELPQYTCHPCLVTEKARIRSVFLYRSTVAWVNRSSSAEWNSLILSGDVRVIKDTQGDYDGGTVEEETGFGDLEFINGGRTHILNWLDPNIEDNCDFYTALESQTEWMIGYRTSSKIWFSNEVATYTPKVPVENNLKGVVTYQTSAKWTGDMPCPYDTPAGIFERCFAVSA